MSGNKSASEGSSHKGRKRGNSSMDQGSPLANKSNTIAPPPAKRGRSRKDRNGESKKTSDPNHDGVKDLAPSEVAGDTTEASSPAVAGAKTAAKASPRQRGRPRKNRVPAAIKKTTLGVANNVSTVASPATADAGASDMAGSPATVGHTGATFTPVPGGEDALKGQHASGDARKKESLDASAAGSANTSSPASNKQVRFALAKQEDDETTSHKWAAENTANGGNQPAQTDAWFLSPEAARDPVQALGLVHDVFLINSVAQNGGLVLPHELAMHLHAAVAPGMPTPNGDVFVPAALAMRIRQEVFGVDSPFMGSF
ncbi:hypothetical protein F4780DRAFT_774199 [Xylariomycetidae sp. FL0641]|nr:hypothetical protein F4780DRAFT_774199 [Xylariomycetidae sp. FL0641]